jgi:hypothetical protein
VHQEQCSILILYLHDMSLATMAWRKAVVLDPMARLAAIEIGVIPGLLALADDAAISTSLRPGSFLLLFFPPRGRR